MHTEAPNDDADRRDEITAAVQDNTRNRSVIDQAKGMITFLYGVDAGL